MNGTVAVSLQCSWYGSHCAFIKHVSTMMVAEDRQPSIFSCRLSSAYMVFSFLFSSTYLGHFVCRLRFSPGFTIYDIPLSSGYRRYLSIFMFLDQAHFPDIHHRKLYHSPSCYSMTEHLNLLKLALRLISRVIFHAGIFLTYTDAVPLKLYARNRTLIGEENMISRCISPYLTGTAMNSFLNSII